MTVRIGLTKPRIVDIHLIICMLSEIRTACQ